MLFTYEIFFSLPEQYYQNTGETNQNPTGHHLNQYSLDQYQPSQYLPNQYPQSQYSQSQYSQSQYPQKHLETHYSRNEYSQNEYSHSPYLPQDYSQNQYSQSEYQQDHFLQDQFAGQYTTEEKKSYYTKSFNKSISTESKPKNKISDTKGKKRYSNRTKMRVTPGTRIKKDDMDDPQSQRDLLITQLTRDQYECMICCDIIKSRVAVWSCKSCHHVFHLFCAKKWAKSSKLDVDGKLFFIMLKLFKSIFNHLHISNCYKVYIIIIY